MLANPPMKLGLTSKFCDSTEQLNTTGCGPSNNAKTADFDRSAKPNARREGRAAKRDARREDCWAKPDARGEGTAKRRKLAAHSTEGWLGGLRGIHAPCRGLWSLAGQRRLQLSPRSTAELCFAAPAAAAGIHARRGRSPGTPRAGGYAASTRLPPALRSAHAAAPLPPGAAAARRSPFTAQSTGPSAHCRGG